MFRKRIISIFFFCLAILTFNGCNYIKANEENILELSQQSSVYSGENISLPIDNLSEEYNKKITLAGEQVENINNAGNYVIEIKKNSKIYKFNYQVIKATCDINFEELSSVYNGDEKQIIATSNINEEYTIDLKIQNDEKLINAKSYNVTATLNSKNYIATKSVTYTIEKSTIEFTTQDQISAYTGEAISFYNYTFNSNLCLSFYNQVTTNFPNYNIEIMYDNSEILPIKIGNYKVLITVYNDNYYSQKTSSLSIIKGECEVNISKNIYEYNFLKIDFSKYLISNISDYIYSIDYLDDGVSVGEHEVKICVENDYYFKEKIFTYNIVKKEVNFDLENQISEYTGSEINYNLIDNNYNYEVLYTQENQAPSNAGVYNVKVIIIDDNYCGEANATLTINKKEIDLNIINDSEIYSGKAQICEVTNDKNIAVNILKYNSDILINDIINVGTYKIIASIEDENYYGYDEFNFTVIPKEVTYELINSTYFYTGNNIDIVYTCSEDIQNNIEIILNNQKVSSINNIGEYLVSIAPITNNYYGQLQSLITVELEYNQDNWDYVYNNFLNQNSVNFSATGDMKCIYSGKVDEYINTKTLSKVNEKILFEEDYYARSLYKDSRAIKVDYDENISTYNLSENVNSYGATFDEENIKEIDENFGMSFYGLLYNLEYIESTNEEIKLGISAENMLLYQKYLSLVFKEDITLNYIEISSTFDANNDIESFSFKLKYISTTTSYFENITISI